jgi:hypothetical protein
LGEAVGADAAPHGGATQAAQEHGPLAIALPLLLGAPGDRVGTHDGLIDEAAARGMANAAVEGDGEVAERFEAPIA